MDWKVPNGQGFELGRDNSLLSFSKLFQAFLIIPSRLFVEDLKALSLSLSALNGDTSL